MPTPYFRIMHGSTDITGRIGINNISLTISDGVGVDADTATYEIDDRNGRIAPPKTGEEITIEGGYLEGPKRDFGTFIIDQVTLAGFPQRITVNAQSAGAKTAIKQKRRKSYSKDDYPTYGDIFSEVAGRAGLSLAMSDDLKSIKVEHEAQAEENDLEFATRIGASLDAHVSVKSKRLVVVKKGAGKSASGQDLPEFVVAKGLNLLDYSVNVKDTPKHKTVKATYNDRQKVTPGEVEVESGDEGPEFLIREPFPTKDEAERAAKAKAAELKRIEGQADFTVEGDPQVIAEQIIVCKRVRSLVNGRWRSTQVSNNWVGSSAYTTQISCEKPE